MKIISRRSLTALFCLTLLFPAATYASEKASTLSADEVLAKLMEGNRHFVTGTQQHPDEDAARRLTQSKGQTPTAIVLTCADSRVAPELCFDQGIGTLFVIRNAGNVLDDHVIGSIEYAVAHLNVPLIIVMGHANCGAVTAAVSGGHAPGHIHSIVESMEPAIDEVKNQAGDKVDNAVRANARYVAGVLNRVQPIIGEAVAAGKVKVIAGRYDISSGVFEVLN